MLYLFAALYAEAAEVIRALGMQRMYPQERLQRFSCDAGILTITGIGPAAAAIAVSETICRRTVHETDLLVNFGTCAAAGREFSTGETAAVNRIYDVCSERWFCPDMVVKHPFRESAIETRGTLYVSPGTAAAPLVDMESAGVYQAGSCYLEQHQMLFLKVVSDFGTSMPDANQVREYIGKSGIPEYLRTLSETPEPVNDAAEEVKACQSLLSRHLCCSRTMEAELAQILRFLSLSGTDIRQISDRMLTEEPCRSRQEGKGKLAFLRSLCG